jgi:hypothetical protein
VINRTKNLNSKPQLVRMQLPRHLRRLLPRKPIWTSCTILLEGKLQSVTSAVARAFIPVIAKEICAYSTRTRFAASAEPTKWWSVMERQAMVEADPINPMRMIISEQLRFSVTPVNTMPRANAAWSTVHILSSRSCRSRLLSSRSIFTRSSRVSRSLLTSSSCKTLSINSR